MSNIEEWIKSGTGESYKTWLKDKYKSNNAKHKKALTEAREILRGLPRTPPLKRALGVIDEALGEG